MRRLGIIVLVVGLLGFALGTVQRGGYDTVEGAIKTAVSSDGGKEGRVGDDPLAFTRRRGAGRRPRHPAGKKELTGV